MLELDEYEMDGIAKLLHIAKRFADRGRLDLLLQASGKDAILSVETYLELEYDLPCLIFEDVTVQRHPEDDWRMFSERTVYIMRDSLLSRFDQLCREYEAVRGILPIENPFVSTLRTAFGTSPDTAASWCPTAQWMGISRAFRSVWTMRKTRSGSSAGSQAGAAPTESDAPRGFMLPGILAPRPPT